MAGDIVRQELDRIERRFGEAVDPLALEEIGAVALELAEIQYLDSRSASFRNFARREVRRAVAKAADLARQGLIARIANRGGVAP